MFLMMIVQRVKAPRHRQFIVLDRWSFLQLYCSHQTQCYPESAVAMTQLLLLRSPSVAGIQREQWSTSTLLFPLSQTKTIPTINPPRIKERKINQNLSLPSGVNKIPIAVLYQASTR